MEIEELQTRTDSRKSFYGKAKLLHNGNITELQSYETIVAEYNHKTNKIKVFGWFSNITARHINEFLSFYGFDKVTKKEMKNWENEA